MPQKHSHDLKAGKANSYDSMLTVILTLLILFIGHSVSADTKSDSGTDPIRLRWALIIATLVGVALIKGHVHAKGDIGNLRKSMKQLESAIIITFPYHPHRTDLGGARTVDGLLKHIGWSMKAHIFVTSVLGVYTVLELVSSDVSLLDNIRSLF